MEALSEANCKGRQYHISGIVQGVGFRPFVYRIATAHRLNGDVSNSADGVRIHLFGSPSGLAAFEAALRNSPPPQAKIDQIEISDIPFQRISGFRILTSQDNPADFLPVSPDLAICEACREEILNPAERRFHYPFTNCTDCGPRFSIIEKIPYDRPNTSMKRFRLCQRCAAEYADPLDRRFHAQPVACSECGPQLRFLTTAWMQADGETGLTLICPKNAKNSNQEPDSTNERALAAAAEALKAGHILAVKGIGGFHLACDARNPQALDTLRERKHRSGKPFALMAKSLSVIRKYCRLRKSEAEVLASPSAPVVLLSKRSDCSLPDALAPGQKTLGFMLPYTPLHILLFEALGPEIEVLVMTSANLSEEPIVFGDSEDDLTTLWKLTDSILTHNRPIVTRVDDSVLRIRQDGHPMMIRRARGFAPDPLVLKQEMNEILAVGPELKNTFCLTRGHYAFLSHHIGDMENAETLAAFEKGIEHYQALFRVTPQAIAFDLHPNYLSTSYAKKTAAQKGLRLIGVQHHYAHIAAVLAEHDRFSAQPAIGLAFDGTGYGTDGTIWGGEALLCSAEGFSRAYHLAPFPLPGGDKAVRNPARMALALLYHNGVAWAPSLPPVKALSEKDRNLLRTMLDQGLGCVNTSSMGRLFDAVSALLGIRQEISYEGQAAIELENLVNPNCAEAYHFELSDEQIIWRPVLDEMLWDIRQGCGVPRMSAKFHNALIQLCLEICDRIQQKHTGSRFPVALSGGVWQNQVLLSGVQKKLRAHGWDVLLPRQLPFNDGCIAFGQAMVADAAIRNS